MHRGGPKEYPCVSCGRRTKADQRRFIIGSSYESYRVYLGITTCQEKDVTCTNCYSKFYRASHIRNSVDKTTDCVSNSLYDSDPNYEPPVKTRKTLCVKSPKVIPLPIQSSGKSHSSCVICKGRDSKLLTVSTDIRHRIFIRTGHMLLPGARCCQMHMTSDFSLREDAIKFLATASTECQTFFNKSDIYSLISSIRSVALRNEKCRLDFDTSKGLADSDYMTLTGISKENFDDVISHCQSIRSTKNRSLRTCIALLLVKLRTGLSNQMLSTLFNIEKSGVRRALRTARKELTETFTPNYVGFGHISRRDVIENHTRPLAQEIFGSIVEKPAILVVDGTYVYIQKSSNFKFQRRSFSQHKNRPLVKPMVIVSTTGYIVSVLGPYLADHKNNDANILKHSIKTNVEDIQDWLQQDDILVVDRGFRDSIDFLDSLGIKAHMPAFLPKGHKQHTVDEVHCTFLNFKVIECTKYRVYDHIID